MSDLPFLICCQSAKPLLNEINDFFCLILQAFFRGLFQAVLVCFVQFAR